MAAAGHADMLVYLGHWHLPAGVCVHEVGSGGPSTTCASSGEAAKELTLFLPWLTREACLKVNEGLGIDNPGGEPPAHAGGTLGDVQFTVLYTANEHVGVFGEPVGCIYHSSAGSTPGFAYLYYHALIIR